jgi:hypothetical protein
MKISGDAIKRTIPGATETVRMLDDTGNFIGDVITTHNFIKQPYGKLSFPIIAINAKDGTEQKYDTNTTFYKPMVRTATNGIIDTKIMRRDITDIAHATQSNLSKLDAKYKRLQNAPEYYVGIEQGLYNKQTQIIAQHMSQRTK